MGTCGICHSANRSKINIGKPLIRCTYLIKDNNDTQIINYRGKVDINEEIESKVKILSDNNKEKLIFKKKFNKVGINTIDFIIEENLNNMSFMFNKCSSLKRIEFISFETTQVTNMVAMFQECNELEYLDLSNFNTSNVINMRCIFYGCKKLKEIKGINNFKTNNVSNMYGMFVQCEKLEYLDLSNFNTSKVTDMKGMFNLCHKLKEIKGINNFKTNNVPNMSSMFCQCN